MKNGISAHWYAFGGTARGAKHARAHTRNQDAYKIFPEQRCGLPLVLAVSDGHGDPKHFRSRVGAKLAVKAAERVSLALLQSNSMSLSVTKRLFEESLAREVVKEWRATVAQHLVCHEFTKTEKIKLRKRQGIRALHGVILQPETAYGATLLLAIIAGNFLAYLQLGDGDIVTVSETGEIGRPVSWDSRHIANETASLCNKDAWRNAHVKFEVAEAGRDPHSFGTPSLIMLSTDGFSNAFSDEQGFTAFAQDLKKQLDSDDLDGIEAMLPAWLQEITDSSGDDVTACFAYRTS